MRNNKYFNLKKKICKPFFQEITSISFYKKNKNTKISSFKSTSISRKKKNDIILLRKPKIYLITIKSFTKQNIDNKSM